MTVLIRFTFFFLLLYAACSPRDKTVASWYAAACEPLCDDEKGIFLDPALLQKHRKWDAYDTLQTTAGDSTFISFDFISDCCRSFEGTAALPGDTLVLKVFPAESDSVICDCYCSYRINYRINHKDRHWKAIEIQSVH